MPENPTLYVESTIPSYLAARPSRDLVVAAHQQVTHDWWERSRSRFDLFISEAVTLEIDAGDLDAAARRRAFVEDLHVLSVTDDVEALAQSYQQRLGIPQAAELDVLHLACAVVYDIDYLLTWNCRHLANGVVVRRLQTINLDLGRKTPIIVTPEELLETPEEN